MSKSVSSHPCDIAAAITASASGASMAAVAPVVESWMSAPKLSLRHRNWWTWVVIVGSSTHGSCRGLAADASLEKAQEQPGAGLRSGQIGRSKPAFPEEYESVTSPPRR